MLVDTRSNLVILLTLVLRIALIRNLRMSLTLNVRRVIYLRRSKSTILRLLFNARIRARRHLIPLINVLREEGRNRLNTHRKENGLHVPTVLHVLVWWKSINNVEDLIGRQANLNCAYLVLNAALLMLALQNNSFEVDMDVVHLCSRITSMLSRISFRTRILNVARIIQRMMNVNSNAGLTVQYCRRLLSEIFRVLVRCTNGSLFNLT